VKLAELAAVEGVFFGARKLAVYSAPMSRRARSFIVCLLLLAFPLKGAFAAGMIACGPTQDRIAVASELLPHAHDAGQDWDEHADLGFGHAFAGYDVRSSAQDAGGVDLGHGLSGCGNCSACCTGGSLISTPAPAVPSLVGTHFDFPTVTVQFSDHVPAALERPPHTFLV
jgi:hypothetical protein